MLLTPLFTRTLLPALLLFAASAQGAITVTAFGDGPALPVTIGSATISYVAPDGGNYYKFGITSSEGGFGRYLDGGICYYWYHVSDAMASEGMSISLYEIYHSTYAVGGASELQATLVDNATWGDDNYVAYYDTNSTLVAVLRFEFTEGTADVKLLSMAYDPEGLTFSEGILQASAVPEPSGALLFGLGAGGAMFARRRRIA